MMRHRRPARGFSLIELLIVMVIIAILVLVAIPAISNYRETARISAVQSDVRNAGLIGESYYVANDFRYPPTGTYQKGATAAPFSSISDGVVLRVAISDGDRYCVDGEHAAVSSGRDLYYYSSFDGTTADGAGVLTRGVHAGTCSGGDGATDTTPPAPAGFTVTATTSLSATGELTVSYSHPSCVCSADLSWPGGIGLSHVSDYMTPVSSGDFLINPAPSVSTTYTVHVYGNQGSNPVDGSATVTYNPTGGSTGNGGATPGSTAPAPGASGTVVRYGSATDGTYYNAIIPLNGDNLTTGGRNNSVNVVGPTSVISSYGFAGGANIWDLVRLPDGSVVAIDGNINKMYLINTSNQYRELASFGSAFSPKGITLDPTTGDLVVVGENSSYAGVLRTFNPTSGAQLSSSNLPNMSNVQDVAFGPDGRLYVATLLTGIQVRGTNGLYTTYLGNMSAARNCDSGTFARTACNFGAAVAEMSFAPDGVLYVSSGYGLYSVTDAAVTAVVKNDGSNTARIGATAATSNLCSPGGVLATATYVYVDSTCNDSFMRVTR